MKTISLAVEDLDYEAFRASSKQQGRPIAQLIREAMALYRTEELEARSRLEDVPTLAGHRSAAPLPSRSELYDEVADGRSL